MPAYSFYCDKCEKEFEENLTFAEYDKGVPPCPDCGGERSKMVYPPMVTMRYSLAHPRHRRGMIGQGKGKKVGRIMK